MRNIEELLKSIKENPSWIVKSLSSIEKITVEDSSLSQSELGLSGFITLELTGKTFNNQVKTYSAFLQFHKGRLETKAITRRLLP